MPKKPTAEDAQIIMRLYDLRRETEMRKARHWYAGWWPARADDILQVLNDFGTQENAWLRQVNGYWDMAASFVFRGALNEELFFDSCAEMWFIFAKLQPFLKESLQDSVIFSRPPRTQRGLRNRHRQLPTSIPKRKIIASAVVKTNS